MDLSDFGIAHELGPGTTPSIAINNEGIVVEVHAKVKDSGSTLYYRASKLQKATNGDGKITLSIDWDKEYHYDSGIQPRVALNNKGYVVLTHQAQSTREVWYRVGKVDVGSMCIEMKPTIKLES